MRGIFIFLLGIILSLALVSAGLEVGFEDAVAGGIEFVDIIPPEDPINYTLVNTNHSLTCGVADFWDNFDTPSDINVESFSTSLTSGSVIFSDGINLAQDNSNLFWDNVNKYLRVRDRVMIGSSSAPIGSLQVLGGKTYVDGEGNTVGLGFRYAAGTDVGQIYYEGGGAEILRGLTIDSEFVGRNLMLMTQGVVGLKLTSDNDVIIPNSVMIGSSAAPSRDLEVDSIIKWTTPDDLSYGELQYNSADTPDSIVIIAGRTGAGTYPAMSFWTGDAERLKIVNDGSVGINVVDPTEILTVSGNIFLQNDSDKLYFGMSKDVSSTFNASDLVWTAEVGSPNYYFNGFGNVSILGDAIITGTLTGGSPVKIAGVNISNNLFYLRENLNSSSRFTLRNINESSNATAVISAINNVGGTMSIGIGSSNFMIGSNNYQNITALFSKSRGSMVFVNFFNEAFVWLTNPSDDGDPDNLVELMRLDEGGLNVIGDVNITGSLIVGTNLSVNEFIEDFDGEEFAKYQFENNNFNGSGNFTTSGRVGIGIINSYSGLHYQGDIFYLTPNAGTESSDNITIKNYATANGAPNIILKTSDISGAYGIPVGTLSLIGGSKTTHYGGIDGGGGKISLQGGQGRNAGNNPSGYAPILLQSKGGNVCIGCTYTPDRLFEVFGSSSVFRFRDSGATASATTAYIEFGGTDGGNWNRTGWIGDGSSGNTDLYFHAEVGDLRLGDSSSHSVLTLSGGNATFTGNVTAENVFLPQYIFVHNNATMSLANANVWANITFNQEAAEIKKGISHTFNDNTNHTFTINEDGIYDINFNFDVIDTSGSSTDIDVAGRVIYSNGTEIDGSVFETDITKKNIETEISHTLLARLIGGDIIVFQFVAGDVDVQISTHGTFGNHPESATIEIKKVANL